MILNRVEPLESIKLIKNIIIPDPWYKKKTYKHFKNIIIVISNPWDLHWMCIILAGYLFSF